jgi:hypothetical protein
MCFQAQRLLACWMKCRLVDAELDVGVKLDAVKWRGGRCIWAGSFATPTSGCTAPAIGRVGAVPHDEAPALLVASACATYWERPYAREGEQAARWSRTQRSDSAVDKAFGTSGQEYVNGCVLTDGCPILINIVVFNGLKLISYLI